VREEEPDRCVPSVKKNRKGVPCVKKNHKGANLVQQKEGFAALKNSRVKKKHLFQKRKIWKITFYKR